MDSRIVASRGVLQSLRQFIPPRYTVIYISMETPLALCLAYTIVQVQPCGRRVTYGVVAQDGSRVTISMHIGWWDAQAATGKTSL